MKKRGGPTGLRRADRSRFPYEPRLVGGKLMSPVELQRLHRFILDTAVIEAISDEMRRGGGGLAGASAQAAAEEAARITPPACFSTSIRLARSSVPAQPGETVFFARMQDAGSLCRNLTATGHHSALSWLGETPCRRLRSDVRARAE
jgi:hypothetical protein